jgi:hypothetical protein
LGPFQSKTGSFAAFLLLYLYILFFFKKKDRERGEKAMENKRCRLCRINGQNKIGGDLRNMTVTDNPQQPQTDLKNPVYPTPSYTFFLASFDPF